MRSLTRLAALAVAALSVAAGAFVAAAPASAGPMDDYSITFSASDFGSVTSGSTKELTITVTNDGKQAIKLDPMALKSIAYPFGVVSSTIKAGEALNPTDSRQIKVSFTANDANIGGHMLKVAFMAESVITPGAGKSYDLTLSAQSVAKSAAGFTVTDPANGDSLDFGSAEIGKSATKTISITNDGGEALTFDSSALTVRDMKGNEVPVSFTGTPFSTVVAPGGTTTFTLAFAPTAASRLDGFVTLVGKAGMASVTRVVEFTALGVPAVVPSPTPTPSPTTPGTGTGNGSAGTTGGTAGHAGSTAGTNGRTLASTGADSAGMFAGASVALMLLVGGGVALVQRRRRAKA